MQKPRTLAQLLRTAESLPVIVTLDYLYHRNEDSPVARDRPSSEKYRMLEQKLRDVLFNKLRMDTARTAREVPFTSLFSIAEMIMVALEKSREILLDVMNPTYQGDQLTCHSLNVAFISCNVGLGMGLSYKELTELGVAALLHDIGMTKIDADCYAHQRALSPDERKRIEDHSTAGWKFLEHLRSEFPWLLRVIFEEHRRENGNGYPASENKELHPYSRIVGLCDSFEALTHQRIFRKAFHPADAIKAIIQAKSMLFAKDVLRALIESMSMFPVGSRVQLNNNKVGLVVEAIYGAPLRPVVEIIGDTPVRVNLASENNIHITGIVYDDRYQPPQDIKVQ